MTREHIHFVTGRLAERLLRGVVAELAEQQGFQYTIDVLPISVAALMTPAWIARRWKPPPQATRVLLPGYCGGDLAPLLADCVAAVELGPRDLRRLPEYLGGGIVNDYGSHRIEIIAEINHAPRMALEDVLRTAKALAADGADVIDVGCDPAGGWSGVADCVKALRDLGLRVSIDSFDPIEVRDAVRAGAELVLSVHQANRHHAPDWGCEVVAIPDQPSDPRSLDATVEYLEQHQVAYRLDPILEPIGCGFAASLGRYLETRRRFPAASMMMGVGNVTELSDVDSAGVNLVLSGFCAELEIHSVLTTQVIHWAKSSVRELDVARRLADYAARHRVPPKHLDDKLLVLRGVAPRPLGREALADLADSLTDPNYRLFAEEGLLHVMNADVHLSEANPFALFARLLTSGPNGEAPARLDASHAFYLGYELCKARTALTLDKEYAQDEPLNWGHLTQAEDWTPLSKRRHGNSPQP